MNFEQIEDSNYFYAIGTFGEMRIVYHVGEEVTDIEWVDELGENTVLAYVKQLDALLIDDHTNMGVVGRDGLIFMEDKPDVFIFQLIDAKNEYVGMPANIACFMESYRTTDGGGIKHNVVILKKITDGEYKQARLFAEPLAVDNKYVTTMLMGFFKKKTSP